MNNTVDELTVDYEEDGILKIKEIDKEVLSKGAWATVLFRYREWQENDTYGPDRYVIRRYKKSGGEYRQQSKFHFQQRSGTPYCGRAEPLDVRRT